MPKREGLKPGLFKLIEHNSPEQRDYRGHDDTKKYLKVNGIYAGIKEAHSWHTDIFIGEQRFNSVCFEEIESRPPADLPRALSVEEIRAIVSGKYNCNCEHCYGRQEGIVKAVYQAMSGGATNPVEGKPPIKGALFNPIKEYYRELDKAEGE